MKIWIRNGYNIKVFNYQEENVNSKSETLCFNYNTNTDTCLWLVPYSENYYFLWLVQYLENYYFVAHVENKNILLKKDKLPKKVLFSNEVYVCVTARNISKIKI